MRSRSGRRFAYVAAVAFAGVAVGATKPPHTAAADLVLRNGHIYTVDSAQPRATAVAIRDGRIIAVGTDGDVAPHQGRSTETIDLHGRPAYPGFKDSHAHVLGLGFARLDVDLTDTRDFEDLIARIARIAQERPRGSWIIGRGWHEAKWSRAPADAIRGFPVHTRLSAATPDHPVSLARADGHAVLANARAMQAMGITRATPAPDGGEIIRTSAGEPTGVFVDQAENLIRPPPPTADTKRRALGLAFSESLRLGVTTIDDAGADLDAIGIYRELGAAGQLPIRLNVMLAGYDTLRAFERPETGLANGFLTIRAVKLYADGALGSRGAALLEAYSDDPGNSGLIVTLPEELEAAVRLALARGFQVATHAIGDRGNRLVLDLYERELVRAGGSDRRLRIEHAQVLDAADIPRFARLGVIPSMQAIHATSDRPWAADRIGLARVKEGAYAWRKLLASGVRIANGTDAPVEPLDPIRNFYAAVTRMDEHGRPPGGFDPEERMTREEALRSLTLDGAFASFHEHELGSIAVGKYADIVVLSSDIMSVPERRILDARVVYTVVGGKVSYRAEK
ncbi:MAG: amidohydrolase [Gammaproteobacteria bacterium]